MSRIQHSWRRSRSLGNGVLHFHLLFLLFFLCLPFSLLPSPPHILFHLIKWPLTEKGICTQAAAQCTEPALHSTAQRGVMTSYDPFRGRHNCWSLLMQMKQHVDNRIQNEEKKSRESIIITVCAVCVCVCVWDDSVTGGVYSCGITHARVPETNTTMYSIERATFNALYT